MLNSAGAEALGLGMNGSAGSAKLSKERKHRMRELATQKLSHAYHLDEIATSVAVMQGSSSLEDLPQLVLQRSQGDHDARYVHFFHEKIPSRMMALYTPLAPLDQLLAERPADESLYRTRALTKIFKKDLLSAVQDLTEGLKLVRYKNAKHLSMAPKDLILAKDAAFQQFRDQVRQTETRIPEEDQPTGVEAQLLFQRAGIYFTLAQQTVRAALDAMYEARRLKEQIADEHGDHSDTILRAKWQEAHRLHLELRKIVKTNARRAMKDYVAFLEKLEYRPPLLPEAAQQLAAQMSRLQTSNGTNASAMRTPSQVTELIEENMSSQSQALVRANGSSRPDTFTATLTLPPVFTIADLFAEAPPSALTSALLASPIDQLPHSQSYGDRSQPGGGISAALIHQALPESMSYHPLMTESMHALLLCHALVQTPPTELRRYANNVARLSRITDGYPIFLAPRSPARVDWVEVLRRADNWIGLSDDWDVLARPLSTQDANGNGPDASAGAETSIITRQNGSRVNRAQASPPLTAAQKQQRRKQEAILEALADERVCDEVSFQRAVKAREKRALEDELRRSGVLPPKATSQPSDGSPTNPPNGSSSGSKDPLNTDSMRAALDAEYAISSERADAIARWIFEAPASVEGVKSKKSAKGKSKARKPKRGMPSLNGDTETVYEAQAGVGATAPECVA